MIPIYLCEDIPEELSFLKCRLENYILMENLDFKIACAAPSPQVLLDALPAKGQGAVFFLDVDLNADMNGIQLAAHIRRTDPCASIIFTTTHEEMAAETFRYKVEALDYLVKDSPDYVEKILQCLKHVLQKSCDSSGEHRNRLHFHLPEKELFLLPEDIYFIKTEEPHRITIHTACGIYPCSMSLKNVSKMWDGFFQCHKSVLVNVSHIRMVHRTTRTIELDNDASCPCSFRRCQLLLQLLE